MKAQITENNEIIKATVTIPAKANQEDPEILINYRDVIKFLNQEGHNNISHVIVGEHYKLTNTVSNKHLTFTWEFAKIRSHEVKVEKNVKKPTRRRKRTIKKD